MPDLTLEFDFNHPADRMFDILRKAEDHRRFMPLCRESRVAPESRGTSDFIVDYVLASKKYGIERQLSARFEVDRATREVVAKPTMDGGERFSATSRISVEERPGGRSHAVAHISYSAAGGVIRFIPLGPFVRRAFQKIMTSMEKRADRLLEKA